MNERPTLSLPQRKKHFDVRKPGGHDRPRKQFKPRGHQATLDANVGKEVTVLFVNGNVGTAILRASDAYTVTLDSGEQHDLVVFKHAIASIAVAKQPETTSTNV